jgi:hypothetical protein
MSLSIYFPGTSNMFALTYIEPDRRAEPSITQVSRLRVY